MNVDVALSVSVSLSISLSEAMTKVRGHRGRGLCGEAEFKPALL